MALLHLKKKRPLIRTKGNWLTLLWLFLNYWRECFPACMLLVQALIWTNLSSHSLSFFFFFFLVKSWQQFNMNTLVYTLMVGVLLCCELSLVSSKRRKKNTDTSNQTKIYNPSKPRWPLSSQININWASIYELTKKPTNRVMCKIFCRSGYHVQILSNGLVRGTVNQSSKYGKQCSKLMVSRG